MKIANTFEKPGTVTPSTELMDVKKYLNIHRLEYRLP
jgi:hypothetical protein